MTAQDKYNQKMKRIDDALAVREPDRVPLIPFVQTYFITRRPHHGRSHV